MQVCILYQNTCTYTIDSSHKYYATRGSHRRYPSEILMQAHKRTFICWLLSWRCVQMRARTKAHSPSALSIVMYVDISLHILKFDMLYTCSQHFMHFLVFINFVVAICERILSNGMHILNTDRISRSRSWKRAIARTYASKTDITITIYLNCNFPPDMCAHKILKHMPKARCIMRLSYSFVLCKISLA